MEQKFRALVEKTNSPFLLGDKKVEQIELQIGFAPELKDCEQVELMENFSDIGNLIEVDTGQVLVADESQIIEDIEVDNNNAFDTIVYYESADDAEQTYENSDDQTDCDKADHLDHLDIETVEDAEDVSESENQIPHASVNNATSNNDPTTLPELTSKSAGKKSKGGKCFQCDTCAAVFNAYTEYNQHKKSHGSQRYQCSICERWFARKHHLVGHQKTHEGLKLFECGVCQKRYTNQGNLDRHIKVSHRNERRHVCTICGNSFSQISILRQHQSVHITERTFTCDICDKKFKTDDHLKLHKVRHLPADERPKRKYAPAKKKYNNLPRKVVICKICGKRTKSINSHMK